MFAQCTTRRARFACAYCSLRFSRADNMHEHIRSVHSGGSDNHSSPSHSSPPRSLQCVSSAAINSGSSISPHFSPHLSLLSCIFHFRLPSPSLRDFPLMGIVWMLLWLAFFLRHVFFFFFFFFVVSFSRSPSNHLPPTSLICHPSLLYLHLIASIVRRQSAPRSSRTTNDDDDEYVDNDDHHVYSSDVTASTTATATTSSHHPYRPTPHDFHDATTDNPFASANATATASTPHVPIRAKRGRPALARPSADAVSALRRLTEVSAAESAVSGAGLWALAAATTAPQPASRSLSQPKLEYDADAATPASAAASASSASGGSMSSAPKRKRPLPADDKHLLAPVADSTVQLAPLNFPQRVPVARAQRPSQPQPLPQPPPQQQQAAGAGAATTAKAATTTRYQ
jgi:hypothetical protein